MDSVLDFLFLRRLQLNYISPPICPIPVASATGLSIPVQSICPLVCPEAPLLEANFLVWDVDPLPASCCTNVVCFNLYQQIGSSFVPVSQCQQPNTLVVCSAATWMVSAIYSNGVETPLIGPYVSDGIHPLTIPLPFAEGVSSYRIVKNGATILLTFMAGGFELCTPGCYSLSQITSDGETCLSPTTCMSPPPPPPPRDSLHDVVAYWKLNDAANGPRLDSVGTNHLTDLNGDTSTNGGLVYPVAAFANGNVHIDCALQHADNAILGAGAGVSFSFSFWVQNSQNMSPGRPIMTKAANVLINQEYVCDVQGSGNIGWRVRDIGGNAYQLDSGVAIGATPGPWHHVACGFDASINQVWVQVDNAAMVTQTTLFAVNRGANAFTLFNFSDDSFMGGGSLSGMGLWKRRITPTEITRLFNGGAGYPLANFYP